MHFSFHLHILNHLFLLAFKQQLYIITLKIDDNIPTINNKISEVSSDLISSETAINRLKSVFCLRNAERKKH